MPWQDRIKGAAYESPSGARMVLDYEDVSKSFTKLTSAFDFPDANGTFVQDLGRTGRRYPFRVFLWGDDYDLLAAQFESMLGEQGIGRLEHPIYGTVNVVPFGEIVQRDDLKTAANQAVFEVTFWETISLLFPTGAVDPGRSVVLSVRDYNSVASNNFKNKFDLVSAIESVGLKNRFRKILQNVRRFTQGVAAPRNAILREFNSIYDSINKSLDLLVSSFPTSGGFNPSKRAQAIENLSVLAAQTAVLIQTPARAVLPPSLLSGSNSSQLGAIESLFGSSGSLSSFDPLASFGSSGSEVAGVDDSQFFDGVVTSGSSVPSNSVSGAGDGLVQLQAYEDLINDVITQPDAVQAPDVHTNGVNNFNVDDFFVTTALTGAVLSVVFAQFQTKPQAIVAAEKVLDLMDSVTQWRDDNYESLGNLDFSNIQQPLQTLGDVIDTGETYQQVQNMVALAAGFLIQISFSLKQERRLTLDRDRTIIDLVAELYGRVDSELDFFIASNNLTGDEILELPRGKQVVYYL